MTLTRFTTAKVSSTSPLMVTTVSDPAHPVPARVVAGYSPSVGVSVRVQLATPFAPIIQGPA